MISRFQDRLGPNRLGPWGLIQSIADALKLMTKEDVVPSGADKVVYWVAPILAVTGVLMAFGVVAWAPGLIGADLNVGVLYIVALGSISVMAALMAGWSSSNKYAMLAGFRVVAQLLSYEIPMVLAMLAPVLLVRSMRLQAITRGPGAAYRRLQHGHGLVRVHLAGGLPDLFHQRAGGERADAV